MHSLLDATFNGMPASEMYRAQLFPELFPHQPQMCLGNWSLEELEMYVGGQFTPGYFDHYRQRHLLGANQ